MLILSSALIDEMIAHAREQHPIEACGIIAGPAGSDRPTRLVRMRNILDSAVAYQFDAAEWLALNRQMDARGEDPLVFYHSHTASPAAPSRTDTQCALDPDTRRPLHPDAHHVIVSTADPGRPMVRSWRLTPERILNPWIAEPTIVNADELRKFTSAGNAIDWPAGQPHGDA